MMAAGMLWRRKQACAGVWRGRDTSGSCCNGAVGKEVVYDDARWACGFWDSKRRIGGQVILGGVRYVLRKNGMLREQSSVLAEKPDDHHPVFYTGRTRIWGIGISSSRSSRTGQDRTTRTRGTKGDGLRLEGANRSNGSAGGGGVVR